MGVNMVSMVRQDPAKQGRVFGSDPKGEYGQASGEMLNGGKQVLTARGDGSNASTAVRYDPRRNLEVSVSDSLIDGLAEAVYDWEPGQAYSGGQRPPNEVTGTRVDVQGQ